ncbi:hypothetical protein ACFXP3_15030 [Streptomyces sp. NPDC059096]|uniref:hypothetical protein n=1 Tax=Streptomyces sp. NPDC059096 TaxID=3346727 RepID=UPI0036CBED55
MDDPFAFSPFTTPGSPPAGALPPTTARPGRPAAAENPPPGAGGEGPGTPEPGDREDTSAGQ